MENQPEYVSSNFHRLRVTKGDERARKRYVKIIHRSRRDIFSGVNIFKIREKNDCYVMKIDNGRSKIYGAGISRHCSSVRFSGIRTERGGKEERGETKLMQRDCEGIYIYIHRGDRGFAAALRDFWKYFPFVACKRNFRGQVSCRGRVKRMPRIFVYAAADIFVPNES